MKRDELQALVTRLKHTALGVGDSTLETERQEAMDYYHGRNWKPAPEGRSQVIDRVFMDTVEWVKPQVMRVFASTDEIVKFEPVGAEDEDLAEQETAYVNHCILKKNDGFLTLYDAVTDALMLRNGYIKVYWEERERTNVESYRALTQDGLAKLQSDYQAEGAEVEIIDQEEYEGVLQQQGPQGIVEVPSVFVDVKLRVTTKRGELCSEAVPPEEIIISEDAKGRIQDLPFIGHLTTKRRSDLIEMGMPRKFVEDLPVAGMEDDDSTAGRRDAILEDDPEVSLDRSMEEIEYLEAYVRVDYNDDGKAELRKVVTVGGRIPEGAEWIEEIDCIPFVYGVPIRVPHRHIGISLFDLVKELQEIRSALFRQLLDNVNLTNNQRPVVSKQVNLRDLAVYKPGSPIRVDTQGPDAAGHVQWAAPTPIVQQLIPVLDLMDQMKENRTGVGRNNTSIDPDVLKQATDGAQERAFKAANAKIEMIIRLLAETLLKDWMKLAHKYLIKYQDRATMFKMRGTYIPVDPREWKERDDLSVSVGLGTGTEEDKQMKLTLLAQVMEKAAAGGIVGAENIFHYAEDAAKALGFKQPGRYFTDPTTPQFAEQQKQKQAAAKQQAQEAIQQQGQILAQVEQVKGQFKSQGDQIKAQVELQKVQSDAQNKQREFALKVQELMQKGELALAELEVNAFIEGANVDLGQPGMGTETQDGLGNG